MAVLPATMWAVLGALHLQLVVAAATFAAPTDPTLVRTTTGPIQGRVETVSAGAGVSRSQQARSFKGVPFGVVERFQPPRPPAPWHQVRPALEAGATCETAEQCLFLNVNTPWPMPASASTGKGLAVMLFIHGGCNKGGSGSAYQTEELVAAAKNVIVVTLNYRLGIFGWLGGKEVAAATTDGSSGNFGTQDQRLAMQWVQDNIAAFGGDPNRVLLFGESAGASAVSTHVVSERSKGLFAAAAIESGAFAHWNSMPLAGAQQLYDDVQQAAGCKDLECLLKMDWAAVYKYGSSAASPCKFHTSYEPVVDGVELRANVWELARAGAGSLTSIPILMGSNRDEGGMFIKLAKNATQSEFESYVTGWTDSETLGAIERLYPSSLYPYADENITWQWWAVNRAWGDMQMACNVQRAARYMRTHGNNDIYAYFFDRMNAEDKTVYHGGELKYVFNWWSMLDLEGKALAREVVDYWSSLARAQVDGPVGSVSWPKFFSGGANGTYLVFGGVGHKKATITPRPPSEHFLRACNFWEHFLREKITTQCTPPGETWEPAC
eukprot:SAG31_NODE_1275_length_9050_cov_1.986929_2_plen_551_part_00